jgi:DNA-binding XRE family transcriptional regulator
MKLPTVDLADLFKGRISRAIDHLRRELVECGDAPLLMAAPRPPTRTRDVLPPPHPALRGNPTLTTAEWSGALTLPISMGKALDFVEAQQDNLAKHMADEVNSAISMLITTKYRAAVLARERIWREWPWPGTQHGSDPETAGWLLCGLLSRTRVLLNGEPICFPWGLSRLPDDAAPGSVRTWANQRIHAYLNALESTPDVTEAQSLLEDKAEEEDDFMARARGAVEGAAAMGTAFAHLSGVGFYLQDKQWRLPAAGMALLYLAEQDVLEGQRTPTMAIDAGKQHHEFLSGCRDFPRDMERHTGAKLPNQDIKQGRIELFDPDNHNGVQLTLDGMGLHETVIAALRRLRGAIGLRHWAALQRLWSVEGSRQGWVRWTLDAHFEAMGYSARKRRDPIVRSNIAREVETLVTKLELVVYDQAGKERNRAPLILVGNRFERMAGAEWNLEGLELRINDYLYSGIRNPQTGKLGTNWFPAPIALAKIDHVRFPYAHALGMLLAIRWRWRLGDNFDHVALTGRKLLELAGIPFNTRRGARTWNALERTLAELRTRQVLRSTEWSGESFSLNGVCRLYPADMLLDRAVRHLLPAERPPSTPPITGGELRQWRKDHGWTQRELAKKLGMSSGSISTAEGQPNRQLGKRLAAAICNM